MGQLDKEEAVKVRVSPIKFEMRSICIPEYFEFKHSIASISMSFEIMAS